jgi:hypothetical protein
MVRQTVVFLLCCLCFNSHDVGAVRHATQMRARVHLKHQLQASLLQKVALSDPLSILDIAAPTTASELSRILEASDEIPDARSTFSSTNHTAFVPNTKAAQLDRNASSSLDASQPQQAGEDNDDDKISTPQSMDTTASSVSPTFRTVRQSMCRTHRLKDISSGVTSGLNTMVQTQIIAALIKAVVNTILGPIVEIIVYLIMIALVVLLMEVRVIENLSVFVCFE